ncbi:methyltransferase-like protein 13 [Centruroides sculpturatus]|uniref:methyltransferase-like protein 13 n=1 Tax=Centruroides sculpturatus TaxID=218467 RepID=UPI000C6DD0FC|nr:methyltransferase-like protein 13 [Centruroides sculpturatus]
MSLLPKSISNFSKEDYWNKFFTKRGNRAFEWYGEYPQLCGLLHKYIRPKDKLLNIGCGNSQLSVDLYDVGFHNNVNIDISSIVIKQMNDKHVPGRKGLEFKKMDMLQMTFDDEEFSVVLDKGTLDALLSEDTEEVNRRAEAMFSEIKRVLRPCGRYICVSLLQDFILKKMLNWFTNEGWMIRIHKCTEIERDPEEPNSAYAFPTFFVICTKMKSSKTMKSLIELDMDGELIRVETSDEVLKSIKAMQEYTLYLHYIQNKNLNTKSTIYSEVPFMSVGPDIGHRTICYNGKSELSGEYIIEDVQGEGKQTFRRLVFLQNQYVIQSEARLTIEIVKKNKKTKKGKVTKNIDFNYLSCQHHIYMFSGLSFLSSQITEKIRVLMVGLGGGLLPMFMTSHIKQIYIDVVELDEEILKIAVEWFGLELSEKLKVHIADGIDFINNCAQREEKYDIVMLDVDNKDTSAGISCPPLSFVQEHFLQQIRKLIDSKGILILNLACRNQQIKKNVYSNLSSIFNVMFSKSIAEEVNEVVYAISSRLEAKNISKCAEKTLSELIRQLGTSVQEDIIDMVEFFKGLTIVK